MNRKRLVWGVALAVILAWLPPAAMAQTCCQYRGSCEDIAAGAGPSTCAVNGGQPTSGTCLQAQGLCEGTVVCCDTTCRGEPSCSSTTAADCLALDAEAIPNAGATCAGGLCVGECSQGCAAAGEVYCNGECVNLAQHPDHCGECGNVCRDDELCTEGVCQRTGVVRKLPPKVGPGIAKVPSLPYDDIIFNPTQWGSVADLNIVSCTAQHGESGRICNGQCTDTDTDPDHCGACGYECGPLLECKFGVCGSFAIPDGGYCDEISNNCEGGCCNVYNRCWTRNEYDMCPSPVPGNPFLYPCDQVCAPLSRSGSTGD